MYVCISRLDSILVYVNMYIHVVYFSVQGLFRCSHCYLAAPAHLLSRRARDGQTRSAGNSIKQIINIFVSCPLNYIDKIEKKTPAAKKLQRRSMCANID